MKSQKITIILTLGWITILFNYVYGDIFVLMNPVEMRLILEGKIGGQIEINNTFLLQAAILMESAIMMIGLTYILHSKWSRILNLIMCFFHLSLVIFSQFIGSEASWSYVFFSIIECVVLGIMFYTAYKWKVGIDSSLRFTN